MAGKRAIKMDVGYLKHVIDALRLINNGTEEFSQKLAQSSKQEALERWIAGLERSVEEAKAKK